MSWEIYLTHEAKIDIDEIYINGLKNYSARMVDDYDRLIEQAFEDLKNNPHRAGTSKVKNRDDDLYKYDLAHSKANIDVNIKTPNKMIFYYIIENENIVISRVMREKAEIEISYIDRDEVIREMETQKQEDDQKRK